MKSFLETFYSLVHSGDAALDLGAGKGIHALAMTKKGAFVTALEKKIGEEHIQSSSIQWHSDDIRDWVKKTTDTELYNIILAKNLLQFCAKEWVLSTLLPVLKRILKHGGVIGIETFGAPPEPPFAQSHHSYWSLKELESEFGEWEKIFLYTGAEQRKDMGGISRKFFITDIILRKAG